MRSTIVVLTAAIAVAGCSMMPFSGGDADKPTAEAAPPTTAPMMAAAAQPQAYEIKHLVRGPVRRVKVLFNGRTVETLIMSKGRTAATSHCCSADGCETIIAPPKKSEPVKACTTFKMVCDTDGACKEDAPAKASSKI